jgi:glucose 1-dehydrogenase/3-oxoacyl-[acyl-carrier protein] reductase
VDDAAEALGGLDVLVNNPGATRALAFLDTNEAVYDELFDLNVKCYLLCTKRAVSFMLEACGGSIVNVTCIHNRSGFTRSAAYAATEGALIALTSELAEEFRGKGIRVDAVGPGLIEVPRYFAFRATRWSLAVPLCSQGGWSVLGTLLTRLPSSLRPTLASPDSCFKRAGH